MSIIGQIGIDLDLLSQNIARMQEQAATLPAASEVRQVEGAREEPAQERFRSDLAKVASALSRKTQKVRLFVERNAAALEQAASALQETDGADSLAARQANAFVESVIASDTVAPAPSAPTTSSRPAPGATAW